MMALSAFMVFSAVGCGSSSEKPAVETQAEVSETVTIKHQAGETEVAKNPKNVVVTDYGVLDILHNLGVENIKAVASAGTMPEYLTSYADETVYTNVGTVKEPDMEKIFETEPELIIVGGRQADYYEELSKIAPTVVMGVDTTDYVNSFVYNVKVLAEVFGKEDLALEKLDAITELMEETKEKAEAKEVNGLIALANDGEFSVYGAGSRFGLIHDVLGVKPVDETIESSTHGQKASFEYIVEQNPDYLFVVDRTAATSGEGSAPALFDNELMHTTAAYQNNHIVYLDPVAWYTTSGGLTSTEIMVNEVSAGLDQ